MSCSLDSAGKLEKQVDNLGRNREGTSPGPQLKPTAPSLETENCHRCCRRGLDRCPCPLLLCITSSRTKSEPGASDRPGQGSVHTRPPGRNGKGTSGFSLSTASLGEGIITVKCPPHRFSKSPEKLTQVPCTRRRFEPRTDAEEVTLGALLKNSYCVGVRPPC